MELKMNEIVGDFSVPTKKIAIVASRFNEFVVDRLIAGAKDILLRHGVKLSQIELMRVPGAYEIPIAALAAAKTGQYAGIIALGTVIRGETAHFDYVASGCTNGLMQAQLQTGIPMTFGVLTTENLEQAVARAGSTVGNKGTEAAVGLLEMISLLGKIST
jgi:6,7-dimethyl-8-ribityllumazine synthase